MAKKKITKGIALTKSIKNKVDKVLKSPKFHVDFWCRTQVVGNHIVRVLAKQEDKIYFSEDNSYILYNLKTGKNLQYNTCDKNQINTMEEIPWEEV